MIETKLKTKIILKDSLREMPIHGFVIIKNRQFKANTIRTTATALKKEGFEFDVSDKGRIDDVIITRLK